jgi:hypothetical protein
MDNGVGEDEIHGRNVTRRIRTVMVITNCEKKERELIETDGNIRNKTELIGDDVLVNICYFFQMLEKKRMINYLK